MLGLGDSGGIALWVSILVTPVLLRWLRSQGIGQPIRADGPASHSVKAGTPTMGGIAIVCGVVVGYVIGHFGTQVRFSRTGYLAVMAVVLFGIIGFLDDWIKVRHQRSLGLNKRAKSLAQVRLCRALRRVGPALGAHLDGPVLHPRHRARASTWADAGGSSSPCSSWWARRTPSTSPTGWTGWRPARRRSASPCWRSWATGSSATVSIYHVLPASAIDLALVAVALAGACIGFLWWNAAPAKIIMGDTGSLAIGAGLAALCLLLNLDLLLPIIGGLFVMETLSVIAQVVSFRVFHRRIFRMAPDPPSLRAGWVGPRPR